MQAFGCIKRIVTAGADAIIVYFDGANLDEANSACHQMLAAIDAKQEHIAHIDVGKKPEGDTSTRWSWLRECVPSYDSLLIIFDMALIDSHGVYLALRELDAENIYRLSTASEQRVKTSVVEIPVWYGAPNASDLSIVSKKTSLSIEEVIALHTSTTYKVYAVGFSPGFAYMGDIPEALKCARLGTPRKRVPKGAVAIADRQTAVYPSESPGGWNLLGLTAFDMLLHKDQHSESRLRAGDVVKFVSITEQEYKAGLQVEL
ncbi:5-oxoprolinase subunit B family protein [Alteromonas gracilis]|uniref:Allophanate hydrolase subunit 1 n=1 Tax=Alteromonas gracilis TaxID=1479524 RepID=A0ABX5CSY2_9ALTE|nr:allophanate hydrolase subunit 1 [Alteromonas gracilis]PRO70083.1 allophanate hydrolase subunit 1 [Alteromonas gracilis]